MLGESAALEILEAALSGGDADALEGCLSSSRQAFTRLANAEVIQDSTVTDCTVVIRAMIDGMVGSASTNNVSPEGLEKARVTAVEVARSRGGKPHPAGFLGASAQPETPSGALDAATADISPGDRGELLRAPLEAARQNKLLLAGNCHSGVVETALWNTFGLTRYFTNTRAEVNMVALEGLEPGQSTGYAAALDHSIGAIDFAELANRAIEKAKFGKGPVDLEPDAYDVILEPAAVAELLEWMNYTGFSSRCVEEKTSFMTDQLGKRVTGEQVTLVDDSLAGGMKLPFDSEGTPKQRVVLIDGGVARAHVYDRNYGHRAGRKSTGHAVGGGIGISNESMPTNILMGNGDDTEASLLDKVERGLWITRFHYVNGMLKPRRAVMTGLTRDGTFLIENGRLTRGVRNLRFTDSILEAFARIDGLTSKVRTVATWWSANGALTAPTVLIRGFKFSGKTSA
jgi:predicted Zn-dependent protease